MKPSIRKTKEYNMYLPLFLLSSFIFFANFITFPFLFTNISVNFTKRCEEDANLHIYDPFFETFKLSYYIRVIIHLFSKCLKNSMDFISIVHIYNNCIRILLSPSIDDFGNQLQNIFIHF